MPPQVFSDVALNPETQFQISFAANVLISTKVCHEKDDETNLEDNIEIISKVVVQDIRKKLI